MVDAGNTIYVSDLSPKRSCPNFCLGRVKRRVASRAKPNVVMYYGCVEADLLSGGASLGHCSKKAEPYGSHRSSFVRGVEISIKSCWR